MKLIWHYATTNAHIPGVLKGYNQFNYHTPIITNLLTFNKSSANRSCTCFWGSANGDDVWQGADDEMLHVEQVEGTDPLHQ